MSLTINLKPRDINIIITEDDRDKMEFLKSCQAFFMEKGRFIEADKFRIALDTK